MSSAVLRPGSSRRKSDRRIRLDAARRLVQTIVESWRRGEPADAGSALGAHPQLRDFHSLVVELAYEEYCLRVDRGEDLDAASFCRRFPECEHSLWRQLAIDELLDFPADLHAEVAWPLVGEDFHGYRVIEELGRGTFSRVFLAAETSLGGRLVAIKVCRHGADEAETLGKLQHPHIVQVLSVRTMGSSPLTVICMPYVGRTTLAHVLDARRRGELRTAGQLREMIRRLDGPRGPGQVVAGRLDGGLADGGLADGGLVERVRVAGGRWLRGSYRDGILQIATALARALAYAHERGVVHLDLKPSNVLLCSDGTPRLLDFNLCFDAQRWQPRLGGTLPYMSPEQVLAVYEGAETSLDGGSDLFSLAVIVCELLTGQSPFGELPDSGSPLARARRIQDLHDRGPGKLTARALGVSPRCARMLRRCLAERTLERPSTAEVVRILAREASGVGRWRRWCWGVRHWMLAGGLLSMLAMAPVLLHVATRPPYAERQRARAAALLAENRPAEALRHLNRALESDPLDYQTLLLRGRAFAAQEDYPSAIRDLKRVVEGTRDPRAMAQLAFYSAKYRLHDDAIGWGRAAIALGLETPDILSNLGYSYYQRRNVASARTTLERALELDGSHQESLHALALILFSTSRDENEFPQLALSYIEQAINVGSPTGELYRDAAWIAAYSSLFQPDYQERSRFYVEMAIRHGMSREQLHQDLILSTFVGQSDLSAMATEPTTIVFDRPRARRLIEPKWAADWTPTQYSHLMSTNPSSNANSAPKKTSRGVIQW